MDEEALLQEAIDLAVENAASGGRPFGALVVRDGEVLATAVNRALQDDDPTAHAELLAIRAAGSKLGSLSLEGCLIVASGEPCPMCQAAAIIAKVDRIIYAADSSQAARIGLDIASIRRELDRPAGERGVSQIEHRPVDGSSRPFDAWLERLA